MNTDKPDFDQLAKDIAEDQLRFGDAAKKAKREQMRIARLKYAEGVVIGMERIWNDYVVPLQSQQPKQGGKTLQEMRDDISYKHFKTDYKYLGLDSCKVSVLEELLEHVTSLTEPLVAEIEELKDLLHQALACADYAYSLTVSEIKKELSALSSSKVDSVKGGEK